jgi:hypothetical protein
LKARGSDQRESLKRFCKKRILETIREDEAETLAFTKGLVAIGTENAPDRHYRRTGPPMWASNTRHSLASSRSCPLPDELREVALTPW